LCTVAESELPALVDLSITRIGTVTAQRGTLEIIRNGAAENLVPSGFQHF